MPPKPRAAIADLPACPHGSITGEELRRLGVDLAEVVDFSASANPYGPPPAVRAALAALDDRAVGRYPDDGAPALRRAIAEQNGVDPAQVVAGNGSIELMWLVALAYLDPGDTVLVFEPTFGEYARAVRIAGARVVGFRTVAADDFALDADAAAAAIRRERPRLIFLCNPNNPTGRLLPRRAIERLLDASEDSLLVLDEAYAAFADGWEPVADLVGSGRLVILRSMTKDYGIAGLRLGYAIASPDVVGALDRVRPPWSVSAPAVAAGLAALADDAFLADTLPLVRSARRYLVGAFGELGFRAVPAVANYVLLPVGDGAAFRSALLRRGCVVRDCASFGLPAYVRIGVRTLPECRRLIAAVEATCQRARS
ncbi:MAG: histidinol-phosphate aminotransferase family protein [Chloroflexi bacterium]|nr:histidinol-phosphate aminotransferase family protein [Chloroflexota bacterium]